MRIVVRDAEWLVKHVGAVHHEGGRIFTVLTCVGVSNLVSGRTSKEALQKPPCQAGWNKNVLFGFS